MAGVTSRRVRTPHAPVNGSVVEWRDEEGWGVLIAPDGTQVWCHFSQVQMDGYRSLRVGDTVTFDYETPGQDGYPARVLTVVRSSAQFRLRSPTYGSEYQALASSDAGTTVVGATFPPTSASACAAAT